MKIFKWYLLFYVAATADFISSYTDEQALGKEFNNAVNNNDKATIDRILKSGASINTRDIYECTPLHCAAYLGNLELVSNFIKKGANVNARDIYGNTPLHFASLNAHYEILPILITAGADVNARTNLGITPLIHVANIHNNSIVSNHVATIKVLLQAGANITDKTNDGKDAFAAALRELVPGVQVQGDFRDVAHTLGQAIIEKHPELANVEEKLKNVRQKDQVDGNKSKKALFVGGSIAIVGGCVAWLINAGQAAPLFPDLHDGMGRQ